MKGDEDKLRTKTDQSVIYKYANGLIGLSNMKEGELSMQMRNGSPLLLLLLLMAGSDALKFI